MHRHPPGLPVTEESSARARYGTRCFRESRPLARETPSALPAQGWSNLHADTRALSRSPAAFPLRERTREDAPPPLGNAGVSRETPAPPRYAQWPTRDPYDSPTRIHHPRKHLPRVNAPLKPPLAAARVEGDSERPAPHTRSGRSKFPVKRPGPCVTGPPPQRTPSTRAAHSHDATKHDPRVDMDAHGRHGAPWASAAQRSSGAVRCSPHNRDGCST